MAKARFGCSAALPSLLGAAILGMHCTGQVAARFAPGVNVPELAGELIAARELGGAVAVVTAALLALAQYGTLATQRRQAAAARVEMEAAVARRQ